MYGSDNRPDEYDIIYNYENEYDVDEDIDKLRNTIGKGDCLYCNSKDAMEYDGQICFICKVCGQSVHEDIYYRWAAGCPIKFED